MFTQTYKYFLLLFYCKWHKYIFNSNAHCRCIANTLLLRVKSVSDHLTVSVKSSKGFLNSVQDFQHGQPCQQQIETIYFLPFWSVRFFLALPVLSSSLCFVFTRTPRTVLTRSAYRRRHALFLVLLGKCSILTHNTSSTFFEALRPLL